jgi:hypothetical protein
MNRYKTGGKMTNIKTETIEMKRNLNITLFVLLITSFGTALAQNDNEVRTELETQYQKLAEAHDRKDLHAIQKLVMSENKPIAVAEVFREATRYRELAVAMATAQGTNDVPRYDMEVRFAADMRAVSVTGEVHVPRLLMKHDTLELRLSSLFRGLRFTDESGRVVNALAIGDTTEVSRNYRLIVPETRDTVRLRFTYSGGSGIGFGYALDGEAAFAASILTAWYPLLNRADTWVPVRGIGRVRFVVPNGLTVVASGVRRDASTYEFTVPSFFSYSIRAVHPHSVRWTDQGHILYAAGTA